MQSIDICTRILAVQKEWSVHVPCLALAWTTNIITSRMKHLSHSSTNSINSSNIVSNSARISIIISSSAEIDDSIIIVACKSAWVGRKPGRFSTAGHADVKLDVGEDFEDMDMDVEEAVALEGYPNVEAPSAQEIVEHQITHLPFRSWCPHCLQSKAPADPRQRTTEFPGAKGIATVSIDYFFIGSQGLSFADPSAEQDTLPILGDTTTTRASRLPMFASTRVRGTRCPRARCRLGMAWVSSVVAQKWPGTYNCRIEAGCGSPVGGLEITPQESPVGVHAADGYIEGAIRRVAGQIRSLIDAAEFKFKVPISFRHLLTAYAANHAADLITRFGRGKDGRTAWEPARGKLFRRIASVRRMLHVHVGTGQRVKNRKDGSSMAQRHHRWNLEEMWRGSRYDAWRSEKSQINQKSGWGSALRQGAVESGSRCAVGWRRWRPRWRTIGHLTRSSGRSASPRCTHHTRDERHSGRLIQAEARLAGASTPPVTGAATAKRKNQSEEDAENKRHAPSKTIMQESQQSNDQALSASNPAPTQRDKPAAATHANESMQVEQTVESRSCPGLKCERPQESRRRHQCHRPGCVVCHVQRREPGMDQGARAGVCASTVRTSELWRGWSEWDCENASGIRQSQRDEHVQPIEIHRRSTVWSTRSRDSVWRGIRMELPWLGTVQHGASTGIWRTTSSRHSQRPLSARNELWSKRTAIPGRRNAPRTCDHHVWRHVGKTRHAHCSETEVSLATGRARSPRICVREKWSMLDDKNGRSIAHTLSQEFSQRSSDHAHDAAWHRYSPGQAQRQNANSAIVYPMPLVRAILKALRRELAEAGEVGNLEPGPSPHEPLVPPQQSDVVEELQAYSGDVKGGWLDPALVRKTRQDEVNEFQGYGVIDIVPHKQFEEHRQREALAGRKIKPIDTLWSDTNKRTEAEAEMRSRLCAREIKRLQEIGVTEIAGLFASMPPIEAIRMIFSLPPIEAIRMIFSLLMSRRLSSMGKNLQVRLFDIKKAYFNALAIRDNLYIEVSVELIPKDTDLSTVIGILRKSMFGPRDCKRQLGHGIHYTLDWSWLDTRRSLPNHLHKNGHG